MHGKQLLLGHAVAAGTQTFQARNPGTAQTLPTPFFEATPEEVDRAMQLAAAAFASFRITTGGQRADLLRAIAESIEAIGDVLIEQAQAESGLPVARLQGERARTLNQIRIFADMAADGSWQGARIDTSIPDRQPVPKPDVRARLTGLGPVVVFGASNFPLAISVAGTDTVSALAAGCSVVVKAHPSHPGTSELVGEAIARAIARVGLPPGIFALLHGLGHATGLALVKHPATAAVAFTGSERGGRALFDAAVNRPVPIPVYAEMGSMNPVFLLPGALAERSVGIAQAFIGSVNMGVGQFCTNPGLLFGIENSDLERFFSTAAEGAQNTAPSTMLNAGILSGFEAGVSRMASVKGVEVLGKSTATADANKTQAACTLLSTSFETYASQSSLHHEVFGPSSLFVRCVTKEQILQAARDLEGHLTAAIHGTEADLAEFRELVEILETKVGRVIFNGFGTGIEVCASMHHGGPYPSSTFSAFTSIGHASIFRFTRPVSYQSFPDAALPPELQNSNPLGIMRVVNGKLTREPL